MELVLVWLGGILAGGVISLVYSYLVISPRWVMLQLAHEELRQRTERLAEELSRQTTARQSLQDLILAVTESYRAGLDAHDTRIEAAHQRLDKHIRKSAHDMDVQLCELIEHYHSETFGVYAESDQLTPSRVTIRCIGRVCQLLIEKAVRGQFVRQHNSLMFRPKKGRINLRIVEARGERLDEDVLNKRLQEAIAKQERKSAKPDRERVITL